MKYHSFFDSFLPIAPYFKPTYGTDISIKLYAFGPRIPQLNMDLIYARALSDAVAIHHRSTISMGPGVLYKWTMAIREGELELHLAPGNRMTWQRWAWVCNALMQFMKDFEYVELAFDVVFNPFGTIA